MSEASQTMNDAKSTVVMEFSTVQKVVQLVDDSEINPSRIAFKEVILKDTKGAKREDHKTEQIFQSNGKHFMVTGKSS